MAYSVVGKDFYMRHRKFDGSDVMTEESVVDPNTHTDASQYPPSPHSTEADNGVAFTQEQISWFGMSPGSLPGIFKGFKKCDQRVKQYFTLELLSTYIHLRCCCNVVIVTSAFITILLFLQKQNKPLPNHNTFHQPVYPLDKM